jgi:transcriptional regulator with XRE-family HTH domain
MDERRINQTDLGAALGISQSAFSRRLLGQIAFTIDELDKLAAVLDVPVATLLSAPPTKPENDAEAVAS